MPQGPSDPMASRSSYGSRGAEPAKATGPKGPQAKGSVSVDRAHTGSKDPGLAVGAMNPKASAK